MNSERATQALQVEFVKYVFDKNAPVKNVTADELHASSKFNPSGLDNDWLKQARAMLQNLEGVGAKPSTDATLEKSMLTRLLRETPEHREALLQGFRSNDAIIGQMAKSKDIVRDQVAHGSFNGGIQEQMKVVSLSEKLDPKPLALELSCIDDAIKSSNGSPSPELLARQNVVTQLLAAPFMERVRLGLFELKNNQSYDAENMFKQALTVAVRPEVHSPEVSDLRQAVTQKAHGLEVERELPDLFRRNFSQLAANSSKKVIVQEDLTRAANSKQVDPALVEFLTQNYKVLNGMSHGVLDWSDGITQAGVDAYQAKYGPKMFH